MPLSREPGWPPSPELLSRDFASDQEQTRSVVRALYSLLIAEGDSPAIRSRYDKWKGLLSLATEYDSWAAQPGRTAALSRSFHTFGLPAKEVDLGRFVFA